MQPLLTIGVPAYNGEHFLRQALGNIISQRGDLGAVQEVEVLVCDDSSKDASAAIVQELAAKFGNVKVVVNPNNLGFDRNVDQVLNLAGGRFIWTMTQGEGIQPGGLEFILNILRANPGVSYVCINNQAKTFVYKDAKFCRDGNELLSASLNGGQLSQNIFNKEFLPRGREKYYGNLWFHFSVALEMCAKRPSILVKNVLSVIDPSSHVARGGGNIYTFTGLYKIISALPAFGYSRDVIVPYKKSFGKGLLRVTASARLHGQKISIKPLLVIWKGFINQPWWAVAATMVFLTPVFLLRRLRPFMKRD